MYWERQFNKLKNWAASTEDINIEINSSHYIQAKTPKKDRIINGMAGSDGYIILYIDKFNIDWQLLTSMLIHEIGHVILFQEGRARHTEKDAWICGIQCVPKEYIPSNIKDHCIECLKSYNHKNFGWLDNIL